MTYVSGAEEGQNPVLPVSYDWVLSGLLIATLVLAVAAVVVLARSRPVGMTQIFWLLVVLALPVVGPLLFFALGARWDGTHPAPQQTGGGERRPNTREEP